MRDYEVNITETLEKTVTIQAESIDEAEELVQQQYNKQEHILYAEDLKEVSIKSVEPTHLALLVCPMKKPELVTVGDTLESLQDYVGGDVEFYQPFNDSAVLLLNEEGKLRGLPLNRSIENDRGETLDIIAGNFLIINEVNDEFQSLTDKQIDTYKKKFDKGELFVNIGSQVITKKVELDKSMKDVIAMDKHQR